MMSEGSWQESRHIPYFDETCSAADPWLLLRATVHNAVHAGREPNAPKDMYWQTVTLDMCHRASLDAFLPSESPRGTDDALHNVPQHCGYNCRIQIFAARERHLGMDISYIWRGMTPRTPNMISLKRNPAFEHVRLKPAARGQSNSNDHDL
jgi:hypothetical protein